MHRMQSRIALLFERQDDLNPRARRQRGLARGHTYGGVCAAWLRGARFSGHFNSKETLLAFRALAQPPDFDQHESDQNNYDPSVNMEKRVWCSHFDALLNFHFNPRMPDIPVLHSAHCEITTCEVLVITSAVFGIKGKMG
jgi:hypothetical protein